MINDQIDLVRRVMRGLQRKVASGKISAAPHYTVSAKGYSRVLTLPGSDRSGVEPADFVILSPLDTVAGGGDHSSRREAISSYLSNILADNQSKAIAPGVVVAHDCSDLDWFDALARTTSAICFLAPSAMGLLGEGGTDKILFYLGTSPVLFAEAFCASGLIYLYPSRATCCTEK